MSSVQALRRTIAREVGRDEILVLLGLALLTAGLWAMSRPSALVAAGAVILWVALPSRRPFIARQVPPATKEPR